MAYPKHNKSNIYHHKFNCYIKIRMNNQEIIELSKKYEDRKYFEKDPVSFLWKYKDKRDIEVAAVICSILAFGNRQQIYKACEKTLAIMGDSPYQWIMSKNIQYTLEMMVVGIGCSKSSIFQIFVIF